MLWRRISGKAKLDKRFLPAAQSRSFFFGMTANELEKVPSSALHISKPTGWLESRFHFSFADWWDDQRLGFGPLRVVNDDLVKPHSGFGTHPHRDAEIFSYVVDGYLSHADSMGNKEALPRGCVQYLSAGTGITHSIWFHPDKRGHQPQYGSSKYEKVDRHNQLLHVINGTGKQPDWQPVNSLRPIRFHQDVNVYVSESEPGLNYKLSLQQGRQAYIICIEGSIVVNAVELDRHEALKAASVVSDTLLTVQAGAKGGHFMVMEMAQGVGKPA